MQKSVSILSVLALLFFSYQMLEITLQYIPYDTDVAFLRIKQDVIHLNYYRWAFFIHVYTSMFVLFAGFTQFSNIFLQKKPALHRSFGYLYIGVVLFLSAPSGFIMGIHANGGWSSQLAFCLLAIFWMFTTAKALLTARAKDFEAHKAWMYRSFALALSAITLRAWKYLLVWAFHPRPMDVYRTVAWLSWVGNLIFAEYLIRKNHSKHAT